MGSVPTLILMGVNESSIKGYPHASISSRTAFEWTIEKIVRDNARGFKILFVHVQIPDEDGGFIRSDSVQQGHGAYTQEIAFCEKVKEKVHPETYQGFLKCLRIFSEEIIVKSELKTLVADLFKEHHDLLEGFNKFLARCEHIDRFLGVLNKGFDDMDNIYASPEDFERVKKRDKIQGIHLLEYFVGRCHEYGIACQAWIKKGDPKEVMCSEVKRVCPDFLVVGSRGLGPFQRVFIGTVSEFCVKHADCPVISIKRKVEDVPQDPVDD